MSNDEEKPVSPVGEKADHRRSGSTGSGTAFEHDEHNKSRQLPSRIGEPAKGGLDASKRLANPLSGLSKERLGAMGEEYARFAGLTSEEDVRAFRLGATIAGDDARYGMTPGLTESEREALERETTYKWSNPRMLCWVIIICSLCAAVQGMDETVVNGAQSFCKTAFGIGGDSGRDTWLLGLTNSAPHLCCAVLGCWLTDPMNKAFGRRGTISISCLIPALACSWQASTNNWWHMSIARFSLGLSIGPESATTPIFAAEYDSPAHIGCIALGIYLFAAVYSPDEGPVPFTYSAEAYPLYIRPIGMSLATATTCWHAGWNVAGFFLVLFLAPETKERTLEELDRVFDVPLRRQIAFGARQAGWWWRRYVLRKDVQKPRLPCEGGGGGKEGMFVGEGRV
ncbi:hypothetical protein OQA88_11391 [Cercophora sp. LCS_1]